MNNKNAVVHFEMPAYDRKRVIDFYSKAFGWEMQQLGSEFGDYVMAMTTESDKNGPKNLGAINGGFYQRATDEPAQYPSVVVNVENLEEQMKKVVDSGGKILGEPMAIGGVGRYISFEDTEGNRVGMMQMIANNSDGK